MLKQTFCAAISALMMSSISFAALPTSPDSTTTRLPRAVVEKMVTAGLISPAQILEVTPAEAEAALEAQAVVRQADLGAGVLICLPLACYVLYKIRQSNTTPPGRID